MADLFDLFEIEVEGVETTVSATQKAKDTKVKNEKAKKEVKKAVNELEEINNETILRFASLNHGIGDYFTDEEISNGVTIIDDKDGQEKTNKISKEDIRVRMERDYPELTKELTDMVYVKEKNMIVVMNAAGKKGANQETVPTMGTVFLKKNILYYQDTDTAKRIKVPYWVLTKFISLARGIAATKGTEVHADIYYRSEDDSFHFHVPPQVASTYLVTPYLPLIEDRETLARMDKVMEVHSHHTMAPIPSATDNSSERKGIYYCIIGRVQQFFPEVFTRTFDVSQQRHIVLSPFDVFETPVELPTQYPQIKFE